MSMVSSGEVASSNVEMVAVCLVGMHHVVNWSLINFWASGAAEYSSQRVMDIGVPRLCCMMFCVRVGSLIGVE